MGHRDVRVWVPMTKRVAQRIDQLYPKWLSFVRSHRTWDTDSLIVFVTGGFWVWVIFFWGGRSIPTFTVSILFLIQIIRLQEQARKGLHPQISHQGRGKYSSKVNSFGTAQSEKENSKEESMPGVWWWYLTSHPHSGIRHHGQLFEERLGFGWGKKL